MHRCGSKQIFGCAEDFAQMFPNLPKSCRATFADRFCGVTSTKMVLTSFSANFERIVRSQTTLGPIFAQIFRDFA